MTKIVIIGGGAAGMMCAAHLIESFGDKNINITLVEKNARLGRKVAISGGGRSNITTGIIDKKTILSKYIRGSELLKPSLGLFPPTKVRNWFETHGVSTKCEKDLRVFPVSDRGEESVEVFERLFLKYAAIVDLQFETTVTQIEKTPLNTFFIHTIHKNGDPRSTEADILVITTGGNAYAHTGSSGDGYSFAKSLGHTITPLAPSLSSFISFEEKLFELSGLVFENARISYESISAEGPILFTHFGISGPGVFSLSAKIAYTDISSKNPIIVKIAPIADWGESIWNEQLTHSFQEHGAKLTKNILGNFLPKRLLEILPQEEKFQYLLPIFEKKCSEVSKEERKNLCQLFGNGIPITLISRKPGDEFVTAGGISSEEIQKNTLESKLHANVYFGGEVLDIDGVTGGFNLQSAWCTGFMIADTIGKRLVSPASSG